MSVSPSHLEALAAAAVGQVRVLERWLQWHPDRSTRPWQSGEHCRTSLLHRAWCLAAGRGQAAVLALLLDEGLALRTEELEYAWLVASRHPHPQVLTVLHDRWQARCRLRLAELAQQWDSA